MGLTPMTLTITTGRNTGRTMSPSRKITLVILTIVLIGRIGTPHPPSGSVSMDAIQ